jgi:guanine deaminase
VGERTLLAHAIWLSDDEWDRVARRGAAIAHCPDSNFFLGSGCMPLRKATARGIRVGLGTDMDAPAHLSGRALIDWLLFRHDAGPVRALYVRGRRLD